MSLHEAAINTLRAAKKADEMFAGLPPDATFTVAELYENYKPLSKAFERLENALDDQQANELRRTEE